MKEIFFIILLGSFFLVGCTPVFKVSHNGGGVLYDTISFQYSDTNEKLIIHK